MMKYIIFLGLLLPVIAFAALPDYYPKVLSYAGVVNNLDYSKQTITINGKTFAYVKSVKVHSLYNKNSYIGNIRKGNKVAYSWIRDNKNDYIIVEIWILPDNYIFEMGMHEAGCPALAPV